jgi:hypothetical protein
MQVAPTLFSEVRGKGTSRKFALLGPFALRVAALFDAEAHKAPAVPGR